MEILYRVYVGAIFGGLGLALLAGVIADPEVTPQRVDWLTENGSAALGVAVALAVWGGLRSGSRGGPLAFEDADVQHVLLAPVRRALVLRGPALRQLRRAGVIGAVLGLVVANFALPRLPGAPLEWLACLALLSATVPVLVLGSAMLASGRRLRPWVSNVLGLALVLWAVSDLLSGTNTAPTTMLGGLATLPLTGGSIVLPLAGLCVTGLGAWLGVASIGGLSLEAARRRAALAAQLRFALSMRDIRAVVLLRRQLASEHPRARPWIRIGRGGPVVRFALWRRDWQSFLRWPTVRVARVVALGIVAGLCIVGAWDGTTPLIAVAGVALFVAGLDAIEPLAQEVDRPTRRDLLPIPAAQLVRSHLVAPATVVGGVLLVALLTTMAFGSAAEAAKIGAVMLVPAALLIACAAALSATNDPYAYLLTPEVGFLLTALPVGLAGLAVMPIVMAREAAQLGSSPVAAAAASGLALLIGCAVAILWLDARMRPGATVKL
jgi:hypothetical protein